MAGAQLRLQRHHASSVALWRRHQHRRERDMAWRSGAHRGGSDGVGMVKNVVASGMTGMDGHLAVTLA
jgi:hypothetical protein